jgi:hypothetical protein
MNSTCFRDLLFLRKLIVRSPAPADPAKDDAQHTVSTGSRRANLLTVDQDLESKLCFHFLNVLPNFLMRNLRREAWVFLTRVLAMS